MGLCRGWNELGSPGDLMVLSVERKVSVFNWGMIFARGIGCNKLGSKMLALGRVVLNKVYHNLHQQEVILSLQYDRFQIN